MHSKRHVVVEGASELLWPWIGEVERAQLRQAAIAVGRHTPTSTRPRWSATENAAWAAGFFDGEGTIRIEGDPRWPAVTMSIPQASVSTVPETLERFRRTVGAGTISGPRIVPSPWSRLPRYRWQLKRFAEIERVVTLLYPYADVAKRERMVACLDHVRGTRARRAASRRAV